MAWPLQDFTSGGLCSKNQDTLGPVILVSWFWSPFPTCSSHAPPSTLLLALCSFPWNSRNCFFSCHSLPPVGANNVKNNLSAKVSSPSFTALVRLRCFAGSVMAISFQWSLPTCATSGGKCCRGDISALFKTLSSPLKSLLFNSLASFLSLVLKPRLDTGETGSNHQLLLFAFFSVAHSQSLKSLTNWFHDKKVTFVLLS